MCLALQGSSVQLSDFMELCHLFCFGCESFFDYVGIDNFDE